MTSLIIWILIIVYLYNRYNNKNGNHITNDIFGKTNKLINIEQNVVINTSDAKLAKLKVNCSVYLNNPQKYLEMDTNLKNSLTKTITKFYSGKTLSELKSIEVDQLKLKNDLLNRLQDYKNLISIGIIKIEYLGLQSSSVSNTNLSDAIRSGKLNNKKSVFESSVAFGDYRNDYSDVECIHKNEIQSAIKNKKNINIFGMVEDYNDNPIKENISYKRYLINDENDDDPIKNL